ncbi:MAG: PAS domain S-box protein [Proteobacteria bacterium]|nr:PAS domain S-box protein [Pseudomonadota bacterium]
MVGDDDDLTRCDPTVAALLAYWDTDLRCRFANHAYEQWFGVSPEALIGTHISDLLGPLYELNRPYIEGVLRGEPQEFERAIPAPDGGPARYGLASYIPDVSSGEVRGFYALVTDISATKRAQLALAESEAKFSGIVEISADAIICVDRDQRITIFNAGAEHVFGYARAEVIGRDLDTLLPDRLREVHRQHLARFLAAGVPTSRRMCAGASSIIGVKKTGEEFPAEATISSLQVGGTPLLTIALRDITERTRLERDQRVLAAAGTILVASLDYRVTLKGIAALLVREVAELCVVDMLDAEGSERLTVAHADPTKTRACDALARASLPRTHPRVVAAIEEQRVQVVDDLLSSFESEALRELSPRSALIVPLRSAGSVLGVLLCASSRPHHFSARDVEFATELAHRLALAIENAQHYEAARRATKARDDVLAIVAHDVRSPLNAIALSAELLGRKLDKPGGPGPGEYVQSIRRSVDRANRLIEDLLDVTRIEAGALSLACAAVAPPGVLDEVVSTCGLRAAAAAIELRIDVAPALPAIWADRDRLLQVFENLVGNAIKFTPKAGRITIAAVRCLDEIVFSVADTGTGIPEANRPYVFDRFWQANRGERHGAGLGLPICKGIVEAHDGEIWVESTPTQGTTFCFTLPVAETPRARSTMNVPVVISPREQVATS